MHEVDMTKALLRSLKDWWLAEGQPQITAVHLHIGEFTCVEPASLQHTFNTAIANTSDTANTFLARCVLQIESIPFVAHCPQCQQSYRPQMGEHYACPQCHHPLTEILSGRELKIAQVITEAYAPSY